MVLQHPRAALATGEEAVPHLQGQSLGSELELTLFICEDPSKMTDSVWVPELSETLGHLHCCKTRVFRGF